MRVATFWAVILFCGCTVPRVGGGGGGMPSPIVAAPRSPIAEIEAIRTAGVECADNGQEIQRNAAIAASASSVIVAAPALARISDGAGRVIAAAGRIDSSANSASVQLLDLKEYLSANSRYTAEIQDKLTRSIQRADRAEAELSAEKAGRFGWQLGAAVLLGICLLGFGVYVAFATAGGMRVGLGIAGAGGAIAALSLAVRAYPAAFALVALLGVIIAAVYGVRLMPREKGGVK